MEVDVPVLRALVDRSVQPHVLVGECCAEEDVLPIPDDVTALSDAEVLMPRNALGGREPARVFPP
jgi:hypothetical protein